MFTTAVHSIKTKDDLREALRYFSNPNDVLSNPIYDKSFYKALEKSRNSIKNYEIFDELFYRSYFKYDYLTDETIEELGINSPAGFHLYQAFPKGTVTEEEAYWIGWNFAESLIGLDRFTLVFTHKNKENIHNHIIYINNLYGRFNEKNFYKVNKEINNRITNNIIESRKKKDIA